MARENNPNQVRSMNLSTVGVVLATAATAVAAAVKVATDDKGKVGEVAPVALMTVYGTVEKAETTLDKVTGAASSVLIGKFEGVNLLTDKPDFKAPKVSAKAVLPLTSELVAALAAANGKPIHFIRRFSAVPVGDDFAIVAADLIPITAGDVMTRFREEAAKAGTAPIKAEDPKS